MLCTSGSHLALACVLVLEYSGANNISERREALEQLGLAPVDRNVVDEQIRVGRALSLGVSRLLCAHSCITQDTKESNVADIEGATKDKHHRNCRATLCT